MTAGAGRKADRVGAPVIFGATGDPAKLETFPAMAGLVEVHDPGKYRAMSDGLIGKKPGAGWTPHSADQDTALGGRGPT